MRCSKYYKTALGIFAAESSIEILHQEQEGILVKKQRSNAAKKSAWVAECNRAYSEIKSKVDFEEAQKGRMEDQLMELKERWEEIYDLVQSLPLDEGLSGKVLCSCVDVHVV